MSAAKEFQELISSLNRWDSRRRRIESLQWGAKGLLSGLLIAVVLAALGRIEPLLNNYELAISALSLAIIGLALGVIIAWLPQRSALIKARFADQQFRLKERTSAAVEIYEGRLTTDPELAEKQLADTVAAAESIDVGSQMPMRFQRRDGYLILLAAALLIPAVMLDNPAAVELERRRAIDKVVHQQISSLENLEEQISENSQLGIEALEELTAPIDSALEELRERDIGREEMFATLSEAEAEFRELSSKYDTSELVGSLQETAKPLSENSGSQELAEAFNSGDLQGAGAELNQLAEGLPALDTEESAALALRLEEAAEALTAVDSEMANNLSAGAGAMARGDITSAQQSLREAAAALQKRAQGQVSADQAAAAADQMQQGREAVAEAGQGGREGSSAEENGSVGLNGTGSEGGSQGQASGDEGESGQPGAARGGGDSGLAAGEGSSSSQPDGAMGGPGPGGGHSENVFVPDYVDLSTEAGIEVELPAECAAKPADCGILISESPTEFRDEESLVPYEQVFGDYRRAAYIALEEEYIPLGLREYVKDYFTSLEP